MTSPIVTNQENITNVQVNSANDNFSVNDISNKFNEYLFEFEQMEQSGETTTNTFLDAVEKIADSVILITPKKLLDARILYHPLMHFLHQMLVDLLANWQASRLRLNIQETDIFLKIVLIFVRAAEQVSTPDTNGDRKKIVDLVATKKLLYLVSDQVADNIINKDGMNDDPNICTLGLLTIKLLKGCPFYYSIEQNQCLIDNLLIQCLDSYDYVQAVRQLQNNEPLTDIDHFLLYTCWEYIPFASTDMKSSMKGHNSIDLIEQTYDGLLTRFEEVLNKPAPIAPPALIYIYERCIQLLNIHNLRSLDKHANHVVDHLTNVLQDLSTKTNDDESISIPLKAVHNLSRNTDIRAIIKKHQITSLLHKYTSTPFSTEIQQLAWNILAQIMDEEEINKSPAEITASFLNQLKPIGTNTHNHDVDNALSSLKALMQHDQIKNEFVKQGGLDILVPFIRDSDISKQSPKQLEDAMEILWSSTFNNPEALSTLQKDAQFLKHVNEILGSAKTNANSSLEKAAEGLIWKVEKEEKFKQQQAEEAERKKEEKKRKAEETGVEEEEEEEQYDCMISYSWADMDLAHQIFHHLTEKLGYKVWLDQEQMHGSTIEAMANAVEGAQFILMCMSETYKRSANCQSEAEYAFNRKKHIVPIKMKKDYTADGWLGFILGTRMYIDFGTYEFEKAIVLLDNEIQLQKKKRKAAKDAAKVERAAQRNKSLTGDNEEVFEEKGKSDKENVMNWDEKGVRDFLLKHNLFAMVPLCDGITGDELSNLYVMCKSNPASMYRSLKFELLHGHHRILPISTFLRFNSRMRVLCDDGLPSKTKSEKKTRKIHSSIDE